MEQCKPVIAQSQIKIYSADLATVLRKSYVKERFPSIDPPTDSVYTNIHEVPCLRLG